MKKVKTGLKIVIFIVVAAVLFAGVNLLVRPTLEHTHTVIQGFYEEPKNTIETLFLGTSATENAILPTELYENFGICAYDLGTGGQPMMASYYWLEEVYRLHAETLDTVVLDVSKFKNETESESWYYRAFDEMKFSKVKYHFIRDYSEDFTEFLSYLIPVLSFHDRWKDLGEEDFLKYQNNPAISTRGYDIFTWPMLSTAASYVDISIPFYVVEDEEEKEAESETYQYFERIVEFCNDKNIQLVLIKTPQSGVNPWEDSAHNTVQSLADQYQLPFFDFNYLPYIDDINFCFATDSYDDVHMNYYGAEKLTDWMGTYLIENCGNRDVRGDEKYAFMEDEVKTFHEEIAAASLNQITDPAEYLSYVMGQDNYDVFISVQDEASESLTEEQREVFAALGLTGLSQLSERASYLVVIDGGEVITEQLQPEDPELIDAVNADENEESEEELYLSCEGKLSDKTSYSIKSGGFDMGNISSIKIDGTEYSPKLRGLNIVVYDKDLQQVVDQVTFDTYWSPERETDYYSNEMLEDVIQQDGTAVLSGKWLELYQYDRLCEDTKTAKELKQETGGDNLSNYLQAFWDNDEFSIYLSANGNFAGALTDQERGTLANMGLSDLSELQKGDSYLAAVQSGEVVDEQCGQKGKEVQASGENYWLCSCGTAEDCSLMIRGTEYTGEIEGLYIAIYDNVLNRVVDFTVYDADGIFCANEEEE